MAVIPQVKNQYDVARGRAQETAQGSIQQSNQAIQRRAARAGNLNAGAIARQQTMAQGQADKAAYDAVEGINAAQFAEVERDKQAQLGREFQTSERLGSEKFAGGESALGRQFAGSESALARKLQSEQFGQTMGWEKEKYGKEFDYRSGRDTIGDSQWQSGFDLTKQGQADNLAQQKLENAFASDQQLQNMIINLSQLPGMDRYKMDEFLKSTGAGTYTDAGVWEEYSPGTVQGIWDAEAGGPEARAAVQKKDVAKKARTTQAQNMGNNISRKLRGRLG